MNSIMSINNNVQNLEAAWSHVENLKLEGTTYHMAEVLRILSGVLSFGTKTVIHQFPN
jgi:hypothetical protein